MSFLKISGKIYIYLSLSFSLYGLFCLYNNIRIDLFMDYDISRFEDFIDENYIFD